MTPIVLAVCCLALGAFVSADYSQIDDGRWKDSNRQDDWNAGHKLDYYAYPRYAYKYDVKDLHTGDIKTQEEERDGGRVRGHYSLVEPDGSIRVVTYEADKKRGFNAEVKKIGPNVHDYVRPVHNIGWYGGRGYDQYGNWNNNGQWDNSRRWNSNGQWNKAEQWNNNGQWNKAGQWNNNGHWDNSGRWNNNNQWDNSGRWNNDNKWDNSGRWNNDNKWDNSGIWNNNGKWENNGRWNNEGNLINSGRWNNNGRWDDYSRLNNYARWNGYGRWEANRYNA